MTKLLISVRSAAEAEIALAGGADLIDVKEPGRGSLGAADASTIGEITRRVGGRVPLSVALGELLAPAALDIERIGAVQYAKLGLSGCAARPDWTACWQQAMARLPVTTRRVAVAYADCQSALAPDPWRVLAHGEQSGCAAVLLDTFDKSGGTLLDHFAAERLGPLLAAARRGGLLSVVAGGLGLAEIAEVLRLEPDYVAVRGAACVADRGSRIDAERVRRLAALVHGTATSLVA